MALTKEQRRLRIKRRIRKIISGTAERPRLSVYRSNAQITAQVIDDISGKTIVSVSSISKEFAGQMTKTEQAEKVGATIAAKAIAAAVVMLAAHGTGQAAVVCMLDTTELSNWMKTDPLD